MPGLQGYLTPDEEQQLDPAAMSQEDLMMASHPAFSGAGASPSMRELSKAYIQQVQNSATQDEARAAGIQKYIDDYQAKPRGWDFTPLAGLFDSSGQLEKSLAAYKPESEDEKAMKVFGLKEKLAGVQGSMSQKQLQAIGKQIELQNAAEKAAAMDQWHRAGLTRQEAKDKADADYRQKELEARKASTDAAREATKESKDARLEQFREKEDRLKDTRDRVEHEKVLGRLSTNKNLKDRLSQYQNLDNALATISNAETLTPQQIHEFQQSIRSNIGIKGTGGVEEREQTYFKSLDLKAANFEQFLTGDPVELAKDSQLVKHLIDLAKVEQANIRTQFDKSILASTGGHKSMYERRQDLKEDLKDAVTGVSNQLPPSAPGAAAPKPSFEEWKKAKGINP